MQPENCCAAQELHVEQFHGMLVFRNIGRKSAYSAQCINCGRKFDLTQRQAIRAVKARAAKGKRQ